MKKMIALAICLSAIAAGVVSYSYQRNQSLIAVSSISKSNVEALTDFESAFREAFNTLYNDLYNGVKEQCPGGSTNCIDISTSLSIPGFYTMTVTLYFTKMP